MDNNPPGTGSRRLVISLHGIRTRAAWQKQELHRELDHAGFRHEPLDYGFFSSLRLLNPWSRRRQVDWFRDQYSRLVEPHDDPPSIIAHSMGTYIVARAMFLYPQIRFDSLILCGSIIPTDFQWTELSQRGQVRKVLNECASGDFWARIVPWFVKDAGPSGAQGFEDKADGRVQEHHHADWRHSDFFHELSYRDVWIPFLLDKPFATPTRTNGTLRTNIRFRATIGVLTLLLALAGWLLWPPPPCRFAVLDLVKTEGAAFSLIAEDLGGETWVDPQGMEFRKHSIQVWITRGSKTTKGGIGQAFITTEKALAGIAVDDQRIEVFLAFKPREGAYDMNGTIFRANRSTGEAMTAHSLFTEKNWGWYPRFQDADIIHFDYSDYRWVINSTVADVVVRPDKAQATHAEYQATRSANLLPSDSSCGVLESIGALD